MFWESNYFGSHAAPRMQYISAPAARGPHTAAKELALRFLGTSIDPLTRTIPFTGHIVGVTLTERTATLTEYFQGP